MSYRILPAALILGFVFTTLAQAETSKGWPAWRGPADSGSITQSGDQEKFPVKFDGKNFLWRAELPGKGCSTPILVQDKIVVTAPVEGKDGVLAFNLDGSEKWRTTFGQEDAGKHRNGSGSNASPVTDGEALFVFFKSGTFAAVELDGTIRWQTDLVERFGKDTLFWDHGTSPVLTEKYVVMARMHQGESWVAAFDKQSGEIAWKVARNYETPVECDHGYTTPLVIEYAGQEAILTWGAEHITIHNSADGELVWSCGGFNPEGNKLWPAIASPVIVGDTVVVAYGRNDRGIPRLHGVKLSGKGDVTETNHLWKREDVGTFVPTPVVHNGRVLIVGDQGEVECLEPATGKTVWKAALPKHRAKYYASPLVAGEQLYAPREDGVVFVASIAGDKFKLLSENDMDESVIGSPIPIESDLLIRGEDHLFRVSAQDQ